MEISKYKLVLASNSPRRKELIAGIDVPFEIHTLPDVDESYPETLPHEDVPEFLARKKASSYLSELKDDSLLITADTVVLLHDKILGKPSGKTDAKRMLRMLSGQTHRVVTGVCLTVKTRQKSFSVVSEVIFDELTDGEIDYYVEKYNPMDKAGAYGVQEWIGYVAVKHIVGSYYNIMGLPIQRLYRELKEF